MLNKIKYNFDEVIDRENTDCAKYDALEFYFNEKDLQPLWVADMDFKTPDVINNAIINRAKHGVYGYAKPSKDTYNLVKEWMKKRHNWEIETSWIKFVNGVVPAYSAAIEAFTNVEDEIIVQTPVYFPLFKSIKANGRKLIKNSLKEKDGYYTMDFEDLKSKITPKTKLMVLCSPHNPVGRVWDKEELKALGQICIENNLIIISDEIHADLVFKKFTPMASISEEISKITLTLNSPGKTFNIAGLNCAYAISENEQLLKNFEKEAQKREISSINVFGFTALQAAYTHGEEWLEELLIYLKSNITFTKDYLISQDSKISFFEPEATYLLWLNFKKISNNHEQVKQKLLKEAKVALNDGTSFGIEGKGYFRLNCATTKANLEKALGKIVTYF
ncbi:MalY/PatB family protein [Arcobacter arenosus]|uniref:MalY/PatB family protein n=1 Tax=Arcobacter arenosus TaxID=2576037 RepID=UPI001E3B1BA4|nr:PatB family C-S lyase [Arcobacter arenosus]